MIHRDLKLENVMLIESSGSSDFVKVLDFGMAKILEGPGADSQLSKLGLLPGTPSAMTPEQISQLTPDPRIDIYATGVLLYEMVVGQRPFRGSDMAAVVKTATHHTAHASPPDCRRAGTVGGARGGDPQGAAKGPHEPLRRRCGDGRCAPATPEARQNLSLANATASADGPDRASTWRRRSWTVPVAMGAALVLAGLGVALAWSMRASPQPPPVTALHRPLRVFRLLRPCPSPGLPTAIWR